MRSVIFISLIALPLYVIAGGDMDSSLSESMNISGKKCNNNHIYIEKDVHLMWEDKVYTDSEDGAFKRNRNIEKAGSWNHAVNYCRHLEYQGYSDWRLPTSDELMHIHNKNGQHFVNHRGENFWTSTPAEYHKYYVVYPPDAYRYKRDKNESNYIRCVRCWVPEKKETLYQLIEENIDELMEDKSINNVEPFDDSEL